MNFSLSKLDQDRFGVVTAKASAESAEQLQDIITACKANGVQLLILRIGTEHFPVVQAAERAGCFLADTLLYFEKGIPSRVPAIDTEMGAIRLASEADADSVEKLAADIFRNYGGHYHVDPHLPAAQADEVYSNWARSACLNPAVADAVLLLENGDGILGFTVLQKIGSNSFDCRLLGVSSFARGKGVFAQLIAHSEAWGTTMGLKTMEYSTQITNLAAQRGLCRAGFLPFKSYCTLHKWFDR